MTYKLADIDVLGALRADSGQSVVSIADGLRIRPSTALRKIKFLEKYIITKNTALIDFSKIGYKSQAFVAIKVKFDEKELLGDFLFRYKQINSLWLVNSGYDFFFEVYHKNNVQFEEFVELIKEVFSVERIHVFLGLDELRKEDFVFD